MFTIILKLTIGPFEYHIIGPELILLTPTPEPLYPNANFYR